MLTLTREQQQWLDQQAETCLQIPLLLLMEAAGAAVANACTSLAPRGSKVACFAGKGNNGGDAYVAARHLLSQGYQPIVYEPYSDVQASPDTPAGRQRMIAQAIGIPFDTASAFKAPGFAVIIDGLLGTGFGQRSLDLDEPIQLCCEQINQSQLPVVSIDVPTGIDANTGLVSPMAVKATVTVTFVAPKPGLYLHPGCLFSGRIQVADLTLPASFIFEQFHQYCKNKRQKEKQSCSSTAEDWGLCVLDDHWAQSLAYPRPVDGHKGQFGHALLYVGSESYPGAGILACQSCLSSGVGRVTWSTPEASFLSAAAAVPAAILLKRPRHINDLQAQFMTQLQDKTVVLLGCGSSLAEETALLLEWAIQYAPRLVLDADALTLLAENDAALLGLCKRRDQHREPVVLTPHPGEFKRLAAGVSRLVHAGQLSIPELLPTSGRLDQAKWLAQALGSVVILKGHATVIASPEPVLAVQKTSPSPAHSQWVSPCGDDVLAKGGSGDVLAGLLAGLWASESWRNIPAAHIAGVAVYAHGLAGEIVSCQAGVRTPGPLKVVEAFGKAFRQMGW